MGSFTNDDYLPSPEELKVDDLPVSWAPMKAAAFYLGKHCDEQSKEFMLCGAEEKDPRKCVEEGKQVTKCGYEFFQKLKGGCYEDFTSFWRCLDQAPFTRYHFCRKQQRIFDQCMKENLDMEKPPNGYFLKTRIHESKRPKPVERDAVDVMTDYSLPGANESQTQKHDPPRTDGGIVFPPGMP